MGGVYHEARFDDRVRAWKDRRVAGLQKEAERTAYIRTIFEYGL